MHATSTAATCDSGDSEAVPEVLASNLSHGSGGSSSTDAEASARSSCWLPSPRTFDSNSLESSDDSEGELANLPRSSSGGAAKAKANAKKVKAKGAKAKASRTASSPRPDSSTFSSTASSYFCSPARADVR